MDNFSIYGNHYNELEEVMNCLLKSIDEIRERLYKKNGIDPIEHCLARIKSEESMREKCNRKGLPETTESALEKIFDAIGIRIVCAFVSDVYAIKDSLSFLPDCEIIEEKDYIRHAKPNGYRSYHMIIRYKHILLLPHFHGVQSLLKYEQPNCKKNSLPMQVMNSKLRLR